jgi:hypothetical protein
VRHAKELATHPPIHRPATTTTTATITTAAVATTTATNIATITTANQLTWISSLSVASLSFCRSSPINFTWLAERSTFVVNASSQ